MSHKLCLWFVCALVLNVASGCGCYRCYCRSLTSGLDRQVFVEAPSAPAASFLLLCEAGETSPGCDPEACHDGKCLAEETCEAPQTTSTRPTPDPLNAD